METERVGGVLEEEGGRAGGFGYPVGLGVGGGCLIGGEGE